MNSSFLSRLTAAVTVGVGGAFSLGAINPKTAAYIALGAAILQAFQKPVQAPAQPTDTPKV